MLKNLYAMELYKLWKNKRFLLFLFLLLLCNIGFLSYETWGQQGAETTAYQKLSTHLQTLSSDERFTYLQGHAHDVELAFVREQIRNLKTQHDPQAEMRIAALRDQYPELDQNGTIPSLYTGDLEAENAFLQPIIKQADTVKRYADFLKEVEQKAKTISAISIFAKEDSFSIRNIEKSKEDYAAMHTVSIDFQLQDALLKALSYPITAVLVMLAIFLFATMVYQQESQRKLQPMLYGTLRGRHTYMNTKTASIAVSSAVIVGLFYGSNLLLMELAYGGIHLSASLQSLAAFQQSTLPISIFQFLLLFFFLKICICFIFAQAMLLLCTVFKHRVISCLSMIACILLSLFMHIFLSPTGTFRVLYYLNPIRLFQVIELLQGYVNFNVFQQPVSLTLLYSSLLFITAVLLFVLLHIMVERSGRSCQLPAWIQRIHMPVTCSLWVQECYKLFWVQKIALVLLAFAGFQLYSYSHTQLYTSEKERLWSSYMQTLQGELTKEKEQFLQKEKTYYEDLHKQEARLQQRLDQKEISMAQYRRQVEPISNMLLKEETFQEVLQEYEYVKQDSSRQFVAPFGYRRQFFVSDRWSTLIFLFLFLLSIANLQCIEYRNKRQILLQTCVHAKKALVNRKLILALLCGTALFIMARLPQLLLHAKTYGFPCITASITSLQEFAQLPAGIHIAGFMIMAAILRMCALLPIIMFCFMVSVRVRQQLFTLLSALLIFLFPLLLSAAGIHVLDAVSLYPLLYNESCMTSVSGMWNLLFSILGYFLFSIACYRLARSFEKHV